MINKIKTIKTLNAAKLLFPNSNLAGSFLVNKLRILKKKIIVYFLFFFFLYFLRFHTQPKYKNDIKTQHQNKQETKKNIKNKIVSGKLSKLLLIKKKKNEKYKKNQQKKFSAYSSIFG